MVGQCVWGMPRKSRIEKPTSRGILVRRSTVRLQRSALGGWRWAGANEELHRGATHCAWADRLACFFASCNKMHGIRNVFFSFARSLNDLS